MNSYNDIKSDEVGDSIRNRENTSAADEIELINKILEKQNEESKLSSTISPYDNNQSSVCPSLVKQTPVDHSEFSCESSLQEESNDLKKCSIIDPVNSLYDNIQPQSSLSDNEVDTVPCYKSLFCLCNVDDSKEINNSKSLADELSSKCNKNQKRFSECESCAKFNENSSNHEDELSSSINENPKQLSEGESHDKSIEDCKVDDIDPEIHLHQSRESKEDEGTLMLKISCENNADHANVSSILSPYSDEKKEKELGSNHNNPTKIDLLNLKEKDVVEDKKYFNPINSPDSPPNLKKALKVNEEICALSAQSEASITTKGKTRDAILHENSNISNLTFCQSEYNESNKLTISHNQKPFIECNLNLLQRNSTEYSMALYDTHTESEENFIPSESIDIKRFENLTCSSEKSLQGDSNNSQLVNSLAENSNTTDPIQLQLPKTKPNKLIASPSDVVDEKVSTFNLENDAPQRIQITDSPHISNEGGSPNNFQSQEFEENNSFRIGIESQDSLGTCDSFSVSCFPESNSENESQISFQIANINIKKEPPDIDTFTDPAEEFNLEDMLPIKKEEPVSHEEGESIDFDNFLNDSSLKKEIPSGPVCIPNRHYKTEPGALYSKEQVTAALLIATSTLTNVIDMKMFSNLPLSLPIIYLVKLEDLYNMIELVPTFDRAHLEIFFSTYGNTAKKWRKHFNYKKSLKFELRKTQTLETSIKASCEDKKSKGKNKKGTHKSENIFDRKKGGKKTKNKHRKANQDIEIPIGEKKCEEHRKYDDPETEVSLEVKMGDKKSKGRLKNINQDCKISLDSKRKKSKQEHKHKKAIRKYKIAIERTLASGENNESLDFGGFEEKSCNELKTISQKLHYYIKSCSSELFSRQNMIESESDTTESQSAENLRLNISPDELNPSNSYSEIEWDSSKVNSEIQISSPKPCATAPNEPFDPLSIMKNSSPSNNIQDSFSCDMNASDNKLTHSSNIMDMFFCHSDSSCDIDLTVNTALATIDDTLSIGDFGKDDLQVLNSDNNLTHKGEIIDKGKPSEIQLSPEGEKGGVLVKLSIKDEKELKPPAKQENLSKNAQSWSNFDDIEYHCKGLRNFTILLNNLFLNKKYRNTVKREFKRIYGCRYRELLKDMQKPDPQFWKQQDENKLEKKDRRLEKADSKRKTHEYKVKKEKDHATSKEIVERKCLKVKYKNEKLELLVKKKADQKFKHENLTSKKEDPPCNKTLVKELEIKKLPVFGAAFKIPKKRENQTYRKDPIEAPLSLIKRRLENTPTTYGQYKNRKRHLETWKEKEDYCKKYVPSRDKPQDNNYSQSFKDQTQFTDKRNNLNSIGNTTPGSSKQSSNQETKTERLHHHVDSLPEFTPDLMSQNEPDLMADEEDEGLYPIQYNTMFSSLTQLKNKPNSISSSETIISSNVNDDSPCSNNEIYTKLSSKSSPSDVSNSVLSSKELIELLNQDFSCSDDETTDEEPTSMPSTSIKVNAPLSDSLKTSAANTFHLKDARKDDHKAKFFEYIDSMSNNKKYAYYSKYKYLYKRAKHAYEIHPGNNKDLDKQIKYRKLNKFRKICYDLKMRLNKPTHIKNLPSKSPIAQDPNSKITVPYSPGSSVPIDSGIESMQNKEVILQSHNNAIQELSDESDYYSPTQPEYDDVDENKLLKTKISSEKTLSSNAYLNTELNITTERILNDFTNNTIISNEPPEIVINDIHGSFLDKNSHIVDKLFNLKGLSLSPNKSTFSKENASSNSIMQSASCQSATTTSNATSFSFQSANTAIESSSKTLMGAINKNTSLANLSGSLHAQVTDSESRSYSPSISRKSIAPPVIGSTSSNSDLPSIGSNFAPNISSSLLDTPESLPVVSIPLHGPLPNDSISSQMLPISNTNPYSSSTKPGASPSISLMAAMLLPPPPPPSNEKESLTFTEKFVRESRTITENIHHEHKEVTKELGNRGNKRGLSALLNDFFDNWKEPLIASEINQLSTNALERSKSPVEHPEIVFSHIENNMNDKTAYYGNVPLAQTIIDKVQNIPLVGLCYVLEIQKNDDVDSCNYICSLCSKKMSSATLVAHIKSVPHGLKYAAKHLTEIHEKFGKLQLKQWTAALVKEFTASLLKIEQMEGRSRMAVTKEGRVSAAISFLKNELENPLDRKKKNIAKTFIEKGTTTKRKKLIDLTESPKGGGNKSSLSMEIDLSSKDGESPPLLFSPFSPKTRALATKTSLSSYKLSHGALKSSKESIPSLVQTSPVHKKELFSGRSSSPKGDQSQTHQNDKIKEFRKEENNLRIQHFKDLEQFLKDPDSHPCYNSEWDEFWHRRFQEIEREGKDPNRHDYKSEWVDFWKIRLKNICNSDLETNRRHLLVKMRIEDPDLKPQSSTSERALPPHDGFHGKYEKHLFENKQTKPFTSLKDSPSSKANSRQLKDCPLSPWAKSSIDARPPISEKQKFSYEMEFSVVGTLKLLIDLKDKLDTFATSINLLLKKALEITQKGSKPIDIFQDKDNFALLHLAKEKLLTHASSRVFDAIIEGKINMAIESASWLQKEAEKHFPALTTRVLDLDIGLIATATMGMGEIQVAQHIAQLLLDSGKSDCSEVDLEKILISVSARHAEMESDSLTSSVNSFIQPFSPIPIAFTNRGPAQSMASKASPLFPSGVSTHSTNATAPQISRDSPKLPEHAPISGLSLLQSSYEDMDKYSLEELADLLSNFNSLDDQKRKELTNYLRKLENTDIKKITKLKEIMPKMQLRNEKYL